MNGSTELVVDLSANVRNDERVTRKCRIKTLKLATLLPYVFEIAHSLSLYVDWTKKSLLYNQLL